MESWHGLLGLWTWNVRLSSPRTGAFGSCCLCCSFPCPHRDWHAQIQNGSLIATYMVSFDGLSVSIHLFFCALFRLFPVILNGVVGFQVASLYGDSLGDTGPMDTDLRGNRRSIPRRGNPWARRAHMSNSSCIGFLPLFPSLPRRMGSLIEVFQYSTIEAQVIASTSGISF